MALLVPPLLDVSPDFMAFEWVLRRVPAEAVSEALWLLDPLVESGALVRVDTPAGPCYELEEGLTLEVALASARAYLLLTGGDST